jgi:hypothetical protein
LCLRSERGLSQARPAGAISRGRPYWATFAITFLPNVLDSSIVKCGLAQNRERTKYYNYEIYFAAIHRTRPAECAWL